ncbi:MAG: hypothetical protein HY876_07055 [Coriobacteriales bacterium]|nr:hypothetical protein [Coriobacteriales bacterium]
MITLITRFLFMVAGAMGGLAVSQLVDWESEIPGLSGLPGFYVIIVFIILGWSFGYLLGGIVGRELTAAWQRLEGYLSELSPTDLAVGVAGLVAGLVVAVLFSWPLRLIRPTWLAVLASLALSSLGAYVGVRAAMLKRRDVAELLPHKTTSLAEDTTLDVLLDTSAIIDGRFIELSRIGFLDGSLRIPRFVLAELQTLADSADDTRRARGRRGLDLLSTLSHDDAEVYEVDYPDVAAVDDKLMRLAAETGARMLTVDYNMTKVARVRGIDVLNVNELSSAVRPNLLPGEKLQLRLVKNGKEADQGVGYLEDGTMVVVQDGRRDVGKDVEAEVTSVLQTSAGRMIFARLSQRAAV